jgi:phenylacetate-coenzyme A ligase PaaK-like adenylate-forming protein
LFAWLDRRGSTRPVVIWTLASSAVRLASAASRTGVRLDRVTFMVQGEPFSAAKRRVIESVGARAIDRYGFVETGSVAVSCARHGSQGELHLFTDRLAVIQQPRRFLGGEVDAFLVTSLLAAAPWILVNVENGDHGTIERRDCGCPLAMVGLRTLLRDVRSHEKLTIEGQTFVRARLETLLEQELPARFGGGPLDYQLVEEEQGDLTRLVLLVDPSVGAADESVLRRLVLERLGGDYTGDRMAAVVDRMGALEIRRAAPYATGAGKVLSLHRVSAQDPPLVGLSSVG